MKTTLCLLALVLCVGCESMQQNDNIRNKVLLTRQQRQSQFMRVWGAPNRTYSSSTIPAPFVEWKSGSSATNLTEGFVTFGRGRRPLDVWEYKAHGVTLWFNDTALIAWQWHDGAKPPGQ